MRLGVLKKNNTKINKLTKKLNKKKVGFISRTKVRGKAAIVSKIKLYKGDLPFFFQKRVYKAGRSGGRIACRHRGGSVVKRFLKLNIYRDFCNAVGQVISIFKDPLRSGFVALILYRDFGVYEYILAPNKVNVGNIILSLKNFDLQKKKANKIIVQNYLNIGNSFFLQDIKMGARVFNVELIPGCGAKILRSAGTSARLAQRFTFKNSKVFISVKLSRGFVFYLSGLCRATLGQCSNISHEKISLKKAGNSRKMGFRPTVRGVAMNPVDHPHGGGEGKTSGGRASVSPWGRITKGNKTVTAKKRSRSRFILKTEKRRYVSKRKYF